MFNPHLSDLEIIRDPVAFCKLAETLAVFGRLDVLGRNEMIRNECDLRIVENPLLPELVHFAYGHRCRDIIAQHQVKICLDELSRLYPVKPCMRGEDFLRHCHSHNCSPSLIFPERSNSFPRSAVRTYLRL